MKPFKIKLEREFIEALVEVISRSVDSLTSDKKTTDDDKLLAASLIEVHEIGNKKLLKVKPDYGCTFTPAQAIAIRLMYTDVLISTSTGYVGNQLRIISDKVHQHYL